MAVKKSAPNKEEQQALNANTRHAAENLAQDLANSDFMKSLDLPEDRKGNADSVSGKASVKSSADAVERLLDEDEPKEEEENQENSEDTSEGVESTEDSGDSEEFDEDLVPQSKVNKRIARQNAKIRALEAQLAEQESTPEGDSDQAKLDDMSKTELKALKRQVMSEYKRTDDPSVESKLLDLGEKIDESIMQGPQRFSNKQIKAFEKAATGMIDDHELSNDQFLEVKQVAAAIFAKSSAMQKSVSGQAEALYLAYDYQQQISKNPKGRSNDLENKRSVNKLKKKLSLDGKVHKGDAPQANLRKLRDKAKTSGDERDRLDYFMKSGMTGDLDGMLERQLGANRK